MRFRTTLPFMFLLGILTLTASTSAINTPALLNDQHLGEVKGGSNEVGCARPLELPDTCKACVQEGDPFLDNWYRCSGSQPRSACEGYSGPARPVCALYSESCGGSKLMFDSQSDCENEFFGGTYVGSCDRNYSTAYEISAEAETPCD